MSLQHTDCISSGCIPSSRIVGSHSSSCFIIFNGPSMIAVLICISTHCRKLLLLFTSSLALVIVSLFDNSHSDWSEEIFHCGFDVHFLDSSDDHFSYTWWSFLCLLVRNKDFSYIIYFSCWISWVPNDIHWILTFCQMHKLQKFSSILYAVNLVFVDGCLLCRSFFVLLNSIYLFLFCFLSSFGCYPQNSFQLSYFPYIFIVSLVS
jgi:hypothetical protein